MSRTPAGKNNDDSDALGLSKETIAKLREISKKENRSIDELVKSYLKSREGKGGSSGDHGSGEKSGSKQKKGNVDVQIDMSKLAPFASAETVELLRRIADSIENIEKHHEKGWTDQRVDLGAIAKKLDKLM
ncbi:MAG: hypothetical protein DA330_00635 [Nitrososphaera sp.]|nr:hypothetical protein [Nitrososphaera sp.]